MATLIKRAVTLPADRRFSWVFLVAWIVLALVAAPLSSKLSGAQNNEASAYLPGGAESTRALDLQKEFGTEDVASAIVVYVRDDGITPSDAARAAADRSAILADSRVSRPDGSGAAFTPGDVVHSADGKALQVAIPLNAPPNDDTLTDSIKAIRSIAVDKDGLQAYVAGPAASAVDSNSAFEGLDGQLLLIAGIVVILILLIVYRSPFLWVVPVASAGVSVLMAQAVNYLLARHAGLTVTGLSSGVLDVLVFGAGTDYALLIISRYREELRRHPDKHEAMALALRRTGPAIVASASTVIIALLCLLLSQLNSNVGLGTVAAVGIACTLVTMSTFLPALLVVVGRRAFWPFIPAYGTEQAHSGGFWERIGRACARRPRRIWVGTAVIFGVLCVGVLSANAGGLTEAQQFTSKPDSVRGQQALDAHFSSGLGSPTYIFGRAAQSQELIAAAKATPGVAEVAPAGTAAGYVALQASLTASPDSDAAYSTIERLRDQVHAVAGADALVGGNTAINHDVNQAAAHDTELVIPLVLLVVFVILAVLLRALVAPLVLMATVVLSFAAALGVSFFFFQHVFHFGAEDPSFPLYAFIFLVALGIDYNIFLMTRVREEAPRRGTTGAAVHGVAVTGGVITSAGVVLAATFGALATLPLVQLVEVGFAVAVGVLLDTFIVRSVLVPALTVDIGRRMWWPSRLAAQKTPGD
jgi:RND superfamily putative drug exporter